MKFLALLTLSLIGTSVAAPLDRRAATPTSKGVAKATPSTAGGGAAKPPAAKATPSTAGGGAAKAPPKASPTPAGADPATPEPATPNSSTPGAQPSAGAGTGGNTTGSTGTAPIAPNIQTGGTPGAPAVQYAAGAFANDATTVSASLNALGTEQNPEMIRALASVAFTAESDEDQRRNVLNTAGGSAAKNANSLIVKNTPAVLDGLQAIMNDPTPANAKSNLQTIEAARYVV
ncbi:hypothetical protein ONS95_005378 [Cadophora gregata]|uniref:uncharacterized protein n=1 Tax=Cadophora gregata TaxID=51156 RepID=UPI0026DD1473|nr:uncharacterized protein ONS95_005378 [Cadophora gregata]KAK0103352.1 hypothetical protein ONS95_005378 [Cadophora gregata]